MFGVTFINSKQQIFLNLITDASNFLTRTVNLWRRLKIIHLRKIVPKKKFYLRIFGRVGMSKTKNFPDTAPYINAEIVSHLPNSRLGEQEQHIVSQLCCHYQSSRCDARTFRKWDWIFFRSFVFTHPLERIRVVGRKQWRSDLRLKNWGNLF